MIQAICWGLIHSLWQGMLLAIAAGGVIFCTKRSTAAVRYGWICGLFFLFLAAVGLTFFYELNRAAESGVVAGSVYSAAANAFLVQVDGLGQYCSAHDQLIVSVWFIFFSVKSVRLAAGWGYMQHLRREGAVAAPAKWVERVKLLGGQLGIRQTVKLVESGLVRVPIVIGHLRPIIFIPLGLINQLPAGEMEAVLLHELAHIRRYDYVVNFLQQIAECLFFFNPGLLWISSLLREERENCCDDIAIARTRDRVAFVRALVRFKEHSLQGGAVLAFPAGKRQLLHRVLRISQQQNKSLNRGERLFLLGSCLILVLLFFSLHRPGAWKEEGRGRGGNDHLAVETEMAMAPKSVAVEAGSKDLIAVLQTREQVAKNLQWVEQQLNQLHHKAAVGKAGRRQVKRDAWPKVRDRQAGDEKRQVSAEVGNEESVAVSEGQRQSGLDREKVLRNQEQDRLNGLQDQLVELESQRQQAVREQEEARLDREQAERDREQAVRDREQAERDRAQAIKDRHQAELDRIQAEKDRMQADKDRMQAELSRSKSEKDQLASKAQSSAKKKA
jgi:bla regulator protein BlaR1